MPTEVILVAAGIFLGVAAAPVLQRFTPRAGLGVPAMRGLAVLIGMVGLSAVVLAAQHNSVPRIPTGLLQALSQVVPEADITLIDVVKKDGTPATFVRQGPTVDTDTTGVSISMTGHDKPEQTTVDVTTTIQKSDLPEDLKTVVPGFTLRAGDGSWVWDCKLVGGEVVCKKVQV